MKSVKNINKKIFDDIKQYANNIISIVDRIIIGRKGDKINKLKKNLSDLENTKIDISGLDNVVLKLEESCGNDSDVVKEFQKGVTNPVRDTIFQLNEIRDFVCSVGREYIDIVSSEDMIDSKAQVKIIKGYVKSIEKAYEDSCEFIN